MKSHFLLAVAFTLSTVMFTAHAATPPLLPNYGLGVLETAGSAGTYMGALGSYWNPAGWAAMTKGEAVFTWNDRSIANKRIDNWGILLGGHGLGASMRRSLIPGEKVVSLDEYQLALAGGGRKDYWGLSYGWAKGERTDEYRQHYMTVGNLMRPNKYVSIGSAWTLGLRNGRSQMLLDLGLRPFRGSHRVTFFGDAAAHDKDNPRTMQWGAGIEFMPIDGIRLAAKISKVLPDDPAPWLTIGAGFSLDATGMHAAPQFDKDNERIRTSYAIRLGEVEPSFQAGKWIDKDKRVVAAGMRGVLTYRKSKWFDQGRHSLLETIEWIEAAKQDVSVSGIALNMSGFHSSLQLAWELGEKLKDFRATGKSVYMYVDRPTLTHMYLIAQADRVWMDPLGLADMMGWVMGGTYYKGMLEKLGVGVEEWRYFEYKSAFEVLARRDMSEKDREQRLALLEDIHAAWAKALNSGLGISEDSIMLAIDSLALLTAHEAYRFGLVDTLGRWDDAADLVEYWSGNKKSFINKDELTKEPFADQRWSEYPTIALVYALGECDMDTGIRGRYTSRLLRKLAKDDDYDAVVLRVDSPGGDGMASDWVADQMRKVSEEKPMIVTQGRVAASGGYWLSSPGDYVFTSPFSITGSIGVIAGWVWNDGLTDKTGLTYDNVQIGEHADLGSGVVLPFLNFEVPNRPVTDGERRRVEKIIREHYDDFVGMVAEDREMSRSDVEAIAQGRVWSGQAAIERNLADGIGGLEDAIAYAKQKAGISKREKIRIVEYPKPSLINFDRLFAPASPLGLIGYRIGLLGQQESLESNAIPYGLQVLQTYAKRPGQPLFMLPPESMLDE